MTQTNGGPTNFIDNAVSGYLSGCDFFFWEKSGMKKGKPMKQSMMVGWRKGCSFIRRQSASLCFIKEVMSLTILQWQNSYHYIGRTLNPHQNELYF